MTAFIYPYPAFPVSLSQHFVTFFFGTYFSTVLILLYVFISYIYLCCYCMSHWLASTALYFIVVSRLS